MRDQLQKAGIVADLYHARMSDAEKEGVQEAFKHGMIECIVATIAFGMVGGRSHDQANASLWFRVSTRQMCDT